VATADYYRRQADTCRHMSRVCSDPVLAERLDGLAAAFLEAAADLARQSMHFDAAPAQRRWAARKHVHS
jgi:hypothetical protein